MTAGRHSLEGPVGRYRTFAAGEGGTCAETAGASLSARLAASICMTMAVSVTLAMALAFRVAVASHFVATVDGPKLDAVVDALHFVKIHLPGEKFGHHGGRILVAEPSKY